MDGTPVLWSQRSRTMHTTPPSLPLPFDRLQPDPGQVAGDEPDDGGAGDGGDGD
jgi:hypothetical protein